MDERAEVTAGYTIAAPGRLARAWSALLTLVVALLGFALGAVPAAAIIVVLGDRTELDVSGSSTDFLNSTHHLPSGQGLYALADLLALTVAFLLASRLLHGAAGDGLVGIDAVGANGRPLRKWQIALNALLPVGGFLLLAPALGVGGALLMVAVLWLPVLFRADRRSVYSLITGTHFRVEVPIKHSVEAA